jgi:hypothetical protein
MPIRPDDFDASSQPPPINTEDSVLRSISGKEARATTERRSSASAKNANPAVPAGGGSKKYAFASLAAVVLLAVASYLVWMFHKNSRLQELQARDWTQVRYDDHSLSDCMGVQVCIDRKARADSLIAVKDWNGLSYNSPLLADCMNYPPCTERMKHAQKLVSVKHWGKSVDKELLADCMGYEPCVSAIVKPSQGHASHPGDLRSCADIAEGIPCCEKAPDPDRCRACKKAEKMADCAGIYQ